MGRSCPLSSPTACTWTDMSGRFIMAFISFFVFFEMLRKLIFIRNNNKTGSVVTNYHTRVWVRIRYFCSNILYSSMWQYILFCYVFSVCFFQCCDLDPVGSGTFAWIRKYLFQFSDPKKNETVSDQNFTLWKCGGSFVVHQTSEAEASGSNLASPTMILMRCRIIVK